MQAIVTRFIGATNHRGARVKATAQAGSVTVSWDDSCGIDENHDAAAAALAKKMGWHSPTVYGRLVGGGLPDGTGNAYVFVKGGIK